MGKIQIDDRESIITLTTPLELRINKQIGMFAVGNIDPANPDSVADCGRGRSLEIAPILVTTGLFGTVGKAENKEWVHVSGSVVKSDVPKKLPRGLVVHFLLYGPEINTLKRLNAEAELADILGEDNDLPIIKIVFDRQVSTQYGSIIKPPTLSVRSAAKDELSLCKGAKKLPLSHPESLVNPLIQYPALNTATAVASLTGVDFTIAA
jgi:hypothetical protein